MVRHPGQGRQSAEITMRWQHQGGRGGGASAVPMRYASQVRTLEYVLYKQLLCPQDYSRIANSLVQ